VTRGALGAVLRQEAVARSHGTCADPRAFLSREVGTRVAVIRGAPGDALSREVGTEATVTRGGPEALLSREVGIGAAVTHDAPRATLRREASAAPGAAPSQSIVGCFW
jgi:hypothetical protein